jgi:hypothetical protein
MIIKYSSVFFLFILLIPERSPITETPLIEEPVGAKQIMPLGRTRLRGDSLELISSGVHFGITFKGRDVKLYASIPSGIDHNYLQFEVDGEYQRRIRISRETPQPITIRVQGRGKHTMWIYKATEATTGPVFIKKISADEIRPIPIPTTPVIEFIGNSITCGAAADTTEIPCGSGAYHDQHNAYYAYGPRVAKKLGVNFVMGSVSGIGMYRTWNKESPSMPQVYEKLDFLENGKRVWEFTSYRPQVVSIALGTNDLSNGDGKTERTPFDSVKFVNNYISFVELVKSKYPKAQLLLLSSPVVNGDKRTMLENCLTAVKKNVDGKFPAGKKVTLYFFKPMQARGCTGHPSVDDHAVLAEELYPVLKGMLNL